MTNYNANIDVRFVHASKVFYGRLFLVKRLEPLLGPIGIPSV